MSLRKAFRSRKFSKSFRKLKLSDEDQEVGATAESSATRTVLTHLRHRRRLRGRICSRSCSVRSYGEWRPARTSGLTAKKKKKKKTSSLVPVSASGGRISPRRSRGLLRTVAKLPSLCALNSLPLDFVLPCKFLHSFVFFLHGCVKLQALHFSSSAAQQWKQQPSFFSLADHPSPTAPCRE
ncbi:hypothetical protein FF1_022912 [Malus domestica]